MNDIIQFIKSSEKIFVIYNKSLGPDFPTIDLQGNAWVFTKQIYADAILQKNKEVDLLYAEYTFEEFLKFIQSWQAIGIKKFILNVATDDHNVVIELSSILEEENKHCYFQSELNYLLIRFIQNRANGELKGNIAFAQTIWSLICHRIPDTVFLVPIEYENDDYLDMPDTNIHLTSDSVDIFNKMTLGAELGEDLFNKKSDRRYEIKFDDGPKILTGKIKFFGAEEYEVGGATVARKMHLRTLVNYKANKVFIPIFTDIRLIKKIYGEKVRVALWSYADLVERSKDFSYDLNKQIDGLVINPGSMWLELYQKDMLSIEKEYQTEEKFFVPEFKEKKTEQYNSNELKSKEEIKPLTKGKTSKARKWCAASAIIFGVIILVLLLVQNVNNKPTPSGSSKVEDGPLSKIEQNDNIDKDDSIDEQIETFLSDVDSTDLIDEIYIFCDNTKGVISPDISLQNAFVTLVPGKANTPYWMHTNKKADILEYLKRAELAGVSNVVCLIDGKPGSIQGASYKLEEVIKGYINNTWTFENAEEDFAEAEEQRIKDMLE